MNGLKLELIYKFRSRAAYSRNGISHAQTQHKRQFCMIDFFLGPFSTRNQIQLWLIDVFINGSGVTSIIYKWLIIITRRFVVVFFVFDHLSVQTYENSNKFNKITASSYENTKSHWSNYVM